MRAMAGSIGVLFGTAAAIAIGGRVRRRPCSVSRTHDSGTALPKSSRRKEASRPVHASHSRMRSRRDVRKIRARAVNAVIDQPYHSHMQGHAYIELASQSHEGRNINV
jgi:hypothetical protein